MITIRYRKVKYHTHIDNYTYYVNIGNYTQTFLGVISVLKVYNDLYRQELPHIIDMVYDIIKVEIERGMKCYY
ncbi:MAG: hypothetical protein ACOCZ5_01740 [bacterium]